MNEIYQITYIDDEGYEELSEEFETFDEAYLNLNWYDEFEEVSIIKIELDEGGNQELGAEMVYNSLMVL